MVKIIIGQCMISTRRYPNSVIAPDSFALTCRTVRSRPHRSVSSSSSRREVMLPSPVTAFLMRGPQLLRLTSVPLSPPAQHQMTMQHHKGVLLTTALTSLAMRRMQHQLVRLLQCALMTLHIGRGSPRGRRLARIRRRASGVQGEPVRSYTGLADSDYGVGP